jgi:phage shock protein A
MTIKNYGNRNLHVYFGKNANAERNLRENINEIKRLYANYKNKLKSFKPPNNANNHAKEIDKFINMLNYMHKKLRTLRAKYQIYHINNSHIKSNIKNLSGSIQEATNSRSRIVKKNNTANYVANLRKQINNIKQAHFNSPNLAHLPNNMRRRMINLFIMNDPRVRKLKNEINIYTTHVAPKHKPVFKS